MRESPSTLANTLTKPEKPRTRRRTRATSRRTIRVASEGTRTSKLTSPIPVRVLPRENPQSLPRVQFFVGAECLEFEVQPKTAEFTRHLARGSPKVAYANWKHNNWRTQRTELRDNLLALGCGELAKFFNMSCDEELQSLVFVMHERSNADELRIDYNHVLREIGVSHLNLPNHMVAICSIADQVVGTAAHQVIDHPEGEAIRTFLLYPRRKHDREHALVRILSRLSRHSLTAMKLKLIEHAVLAKHPLLKGRALAAAAIVAIATCCGRPPELGVILELMDTPSS